MRTYRTSLFERVTTIRRRRAIARIIPGGVVLLLLCGGLYTGFKILSPQRPLTDQKASSLTYVNPSFGMSFRYPANLRLDTKQDVLNDGTKALKVSFFSGHETTWGASQEAMLTFIQFGQSGTNESLPQAIRRVLNDTKGLLLLHACQFKVNGIECLEVGDQEAWIESGNFPVGTTIFLRQATSLFGISRSQNDSFPSPIVTNQILETLSL